MSIDYTMVINPKNKPLILVLLFTLTLFVAMFTNLLILPSLLLTFSKGNKKNLFSIQKGKNRFYEEDEDAEIEIKRISVDKKENLEE